MVALLPPPSELSLPGKFNRWRRGQDQLVLKIADWLWDEDGPRFFALCAPTGSGKSIVYMSLAKMVEAQGGRTVILTSTKNLQNQLLADFAESGLVDVRGMSNYDCLEAFAVFGSSKIRCDEGPCMGGYRCKLMESGCTYFDVKRQAKLSSLVVTNYSYWLRVQNGREGTTLGSFSLAILDESHGAPEELSDYLSVEFGAAELDQLLGEEFPRDNDDFEWWRGWAHAVELAALEQIKQIEETKEHTHARTRHLKALKSLQQRASMIAGAKDWVQDSYRDQAGSRKLKFDPLEVDVYRGRLFGEAAEVSRVLLTSATVRPKTLSLLGVATEPGGERSWSGLFMESPLAFPRHHRPIFYIPTVAMRHGMSSDDLSWWITRIDQLISKRLDRKGIIHTTSYKRAELLLATSQHAHLMMIPRNAQDIANFKQGTGGRSILVSPAVTTGVDFPGDECRWQIIGKVPFPDTRSKILQAREGIDKDYGPYQAMQTIVQSAGRGVRSDDDWCETFIIDDQWKWFWARYRRFAPKWFADAVETRLTMPEPMKGERK